MQAKSDLSTRFSVPKPPDHVFKILLLGDYGVGKSSILYRYAEGTFYGEYKCTIGVDYRVKTLECEGKRIKLQIWDTAGQERFKTIPSTCFRGCHGILIIYDVANQASFANVEKWMSEARKHAPEEVNIILIGNKNDLEEDRREVSYDMGYQAASSFGVSFFEVSAKFDSNVNEAFFELTSQLKKKIAEGKDDPMAKSPGAIMQENSTSSRNTCY